MLGDGAAQVLADPKNAFGGKHMIGAANNTLAARESVIAAWKKPRCFIGLRFPGI